MLHSECIEKCPLAFAVSGERTSLVAGHSAVSDTSTTYGKRAGLV